MADRRGVTLPRRYGVILAVVPVLAVGLADGVIAVRSATTPSVAASHASHHVPTPARTEQATGDRAVAARTLAIRDLLNRRAAAILHRDESTFLATVDPEQPALRAQQRRLFLSLLVVPFAQWTYEFDGAAALPATARSVRYGAPSWAPATFTAHYEIRGFDSAPTNVRQYPTFVHRVQGWFVASFSDFVHHRNDSDVWDYGPLRAVRAPGVLVLGHPASYSLMQTVAIQASHAIPRVSAVWGRGWLRRVVVLVPSTEHELAQVVDDTGDLSQIAAVASAEVQDCPGPPDPVGNRVAINPHNWGKLSSLGQRVVLTHELTHVASRADTGSCTPTWLVEGFADYVGYLGTGVPMPVVAQELAGDVRAGRVPTALPRTGDFAGSSKRLAQAYEGAWLACHLIADRWGQSSLLRFYRAVGTSTDAPAAALAAAMRSLLHVTPAQFVAAWRSYLRAHLS